MSGLGLAECDPLPLIAILRGITPREAPAIGAALLEAGLRCLEVPLNSTEAYASVAALVELAGDQALVGAGTVRRPAEVRAVADAGGRLIVSPHCDPELIALTRELGLISLPGVLTPTEAWRALDAGAHGLKLFPACQAGPKGLAALRAVLPPETRVYPVGGVESRDFPSFLAAGASGFGVGSWLYRPGDPASEVGARARTLIAAWEGLSRPA